MNLRPESTVEFVAFSGLPISGGCGLRQPIYRNQESGEFFAYHTEKDQRRFGTNVLDELVEQELVTLVTPQLVVSDIGLSALYAHRDFIKPGESRSRLPTNALEFDRRSGLYLALVPRNEAATILGYWSSVLLSSAREVLDDWSFDKDQEILDLVAVDLQRARFCTAEDTNPDLRREVILWQLVLARSHPGGPIQERILEDAALELSPDEVTLVSEKAQMTQLRLLSVQQERRFREQYREGGDLEVFARWPQTTRAF